MACTTEYIDDLCRKLSPLGIIRSRKMFGDWMIYANEKPIIIACDNLAYIKMLPEIADLMSEAETGYPYEGAKLHYILDTDHTREALAVLRILMPLIPLPKKREKAKEL